MIYLKTEKEIAIMAHGGKVLATVLKKLAEAAKVGVNLQDLDALAFKLMTEAHGQPAFLGYHPEGAKKPYPYSICTSLNDVIVHGLPKDYELKNGDILKIDVGFYYEGFYTDTATTVAIGEISKKDQELLKETERALRKGIEACYPGHHLGDIGYNIEKHLKQFNLIPVEGLTGHGIGRKLHEDPYIMNTGRKNQGLVIKPGMVFAIEPMTTRGTKDIVQTKDEAYATKNSEPSSHFEHTIAITEKGPVILTKI